MKKITILLSSVLLTASVNAQLFTDDFEGYNSGDYLGVVGAPDWTTWSGATGGAEDVQVGTAQASSGSNSIYFSGGAGGGPQDVVLDFGTQYTSGTFTYESDFYVEVGKGAYFNFQATPVIGTTWAMNCTMSSGMMSIDDGVTGDLAVSSYPENTWFTLRIEANLSTGRWQAFVDGVCIGVWANSINQIASLDLFPLDGDGFYVDDVMYDWATYVSPTLDAAVSGFSIGGNIAGLNVKPTVTIANGGTTAINSFDVTVDYNGNQYVENVTGQNITAGNSYVVNYTTTVPLVAGSMTATATVSNVNGGADDDPSDDDGCAVVDPVVPAVGKVVVGEEATGTWCQWCVRGSVFMDQYEVDYGPYWAGIAVHNNDPMANVAYDAAIGPLIGGYPSSLVDRGPEVDPSAMSTDFFTRLQIAPTAFISNSSVWNAGTRVLEVTVTADFQMSANDQYKLAVVLTEDSVTGTSAGYNQANAYAGGGNGPMGGYELLPATVPAAQMVYNHVAREILPAFGGDPTSFPAVVNVSDVLSKTYSFTLPIEWDETKIHIIGLLINPAGIIDNAGKSTIGSNSGINEITTSIQSFNMYPNPATESAMVEVIIENEADVQLSIIDMSGKEVASRDYGTVTTTSTIELNTSKLEAGVYMVQLTVDNKRMTKRLIIK